MTIAIVTIIAIVLINVVTHVVLNWERAPKRTTPANFFNNLADNVPEHPLRDFAEHGSVIEGESTRV